MAEKQPRAGGALARSVASSLRKRIFSQARPGERLPTERELARTFHCAVGTVRAAMAVLVAEGLVERSRRAGTFVADPLPRREGATALFYLHEPRTLLTFPFARHVLLGMLDEASETGQRVQLVLGQKASPIAFGSRDIHRLGLEQYRAVVLLEIFNADLLERLAERTACVSVDFACHRPRVSSCVADHERTMELAVEQLWLLGHRRIAYTGRTARGTLVDPAQKQRAAGFLAALRKRNMEPLAFDAAVQGINNAPEVAERWVRAEPADRPTAIIVADFPWEFIGSLACMGVRVPGDLSLISVDTAPPWDLWFEHVTVPKGGRDAMVRLTGRPIDPMGDLAATLRSVVFNAVKLPFHAMGVWAMQEAVRRAENPGAEPAFMQFAPSASPGNTLGPPARR